MTHIFGRIFIVMCFLLCVCGAMLPLAIMGWALFHLPQLWHAMDKMVAQ